MTVAEELLMKIHGIVARLLSIYTLTVGGLLWCAFLQSAGDPGNDLRPLASLPVNTFTDCVTEAVKADGRRLSVMEASQLGLVYRAAKRWLHVQAGLPTSSWVDRNPWEETQSVEVTKEPTTAFKWRGTEAENTVS